MDSRQLQLILSLQDNLSKELQKVAGNLDGVDNKSNMITRTVGAMATAFAAAAAAAGAFATKSFLDFEKFNMEISRAGAFVSASEEEMKAFRDAAINAARGTTYSFNEAAIALGSFVGGEIDATTAAQELGGVIDLALIAKLDNLQDAVNMGSLALTVFKNDGMEMSDVIDIIATVAADVTTETDKWARALVNSSGAAKAAGFSFKDLNIMFSAMVRGGADANLVWSAFNSAIVRVQAPTKQTTEALQAVGLSVDGLGEALRGGPLQLLDYLRVGFEEADKSGQGFGWLTKVIGSQAAPEFALALGLMGEELEEVAGYFDDIEGRGGEMVGRLRESIPATTQLGQAFKELSLRTGEWINENSNTSGFIKDIAENVRFLADNIGMINVYYAEFIDYVKEAAQAFDDKTKILTHIKLLFSEVWAVLSTQLGPAFRDLWAALSELQPLWTFLAQVIGVTLVAAFHGILVVLRLAVNIFGSLIEVVTRLVTFLLTMLQPAVTTVQTTFQVFGALLKGDFIGAIMAVVDHFKTMYEWVGKVWDRVKSLLSSIAELGGNFSLPKILGGRATGGGVSGGSPYMVGEQGPEMFVPNTNGYILPSHALLGAGGGMSFNITVNGDVTGEDLVDKVSRSIMSRVTDRERSIPA